MRWLTVLILVGLLAACASQQPLTTDLVKDADSAIALGKKECVPDWLVGARQSKDWHARLHYGTWEVWQGDRNCPNTGAQVSSADGKTNCTVCVT
jgi:hypothetical protein